MPGAGLALLSNDCVWLEAVSVENKSSDVYHGAAAEEGIPVDSVKCSVGRGWKAVCLLFSCR